MEANRLPFRNTETYPKALLAGFISCDRWLIKRWRLIRGTIEQKFHEVPSRSLSMLVMHTEDDVFLWSDCGGCITGWKEDSWRSNTSWNGITDRYWTLQKWERLQTRQAKALILTLERSPSACHWYQQLLRSAKVRKLLHNVKWVSYSLNGEILKQRFCQWKTYLAFNDFIEAS